MSIHKLDNGKKTGYVVRYRDADGRQRGKNFERKKDAEDFDAQMRVARRLGTRHDPHLAKVTVGAIGEEWLREQSTKAVSTRTRYASLWTQHVKPYWRDRRLDSITRGDVKAWIAHMSATAAHADSPTPLSPTTVRHIYRVFNMVMEYAVDHERIVANPARRPGNLPSMKPTARRALTVEEVRKLIKHSPPDLADQILTLTVTGIRFGELVMLTPSCVDPNARTLRIAASATEVGGRIVISPMPKGKQARLVSYPQLLDDVIARALADKSIDDPLFSAPEGGMLRSRAFRTRFDRAVERAGLGRVTPHELRHTYASLAVASGADIKAVQAQLGHASPMLTLQTYSHLYDRQRTEAADRLGQHWGGQRNEGSGDGMFTESSFDHVVEEPGRELQASDQGTGR